MFKYFAVAALGATFASIAPAQDAKAIVESTVKAMGADNVGSIRYTGSGMNYALGQALPRYRISEVQHEDFRTHHRFRRRASTQKMVLTQGENPPKGGDQQP